MKKVFAAVAAPLLALSMTTNTAQALKLAPSEEGRAVYLNDIPESQRASVRAKTIATAQCAVDTIFPAGARRDRFLARTYRELSDMLARLPKANYAQRATIEREAFDLRLTLENANYKYEYVQAAQAVAMAASVATKVSEHGHAQSTIYVGDMDSVSAELTREAVKGVVIWSGGYENWDNSPAAPCLP